MAAARSPSFTDTSEECAICLNALDDARTITLSCGHRWHLACLREQLENARPSHSKRLVFSGCRCAKCAAFCEHPELENLTRRTDSLREKVDALVAEQLAADAPDSWKEASHDAAARARLIDEGRRSYAFYLCGGCDEPYFGGTVDCADEAEGELTTSEDRLCQSCSPKSQVVCEHAFEHRPFHVWKCRYCCKPSNFVCYGNVHFCKECHARNTRRVRSRSQGRGPPALEAIPCRMVLLWIANKCITAHLVKHVHLATRFWKLRGRGTSSTILAEKMARGAGNQGIAGVTRPATGQLKTWKFKWIGAQGRIS